MSPRRSTSPQDRFGRALRRLGFTSYDDYTASDQWKLTANRYRKRACYCCGRGERLEVHHCNYDRLGREKAVDLVTVCRWCHKRIHRAVDRWETSLLLAHIYVKEQMQAKRAALEQKLAAAEERRKHKG